MATLALDLNDAGLAAAGPAAGRAGAGLAEPGYAALVDGRLCFGSAARAVARLSPRLVQRRYWQDLDDRPLGQFLGPCRTSLDLVQAQLGALWSRFGNGAGEVILAVPAVWTPAQLGRLLGVARDLGMPVAGLVDSAVAASRRPFPGRDLWHLEATLHRTVLTRIDQADGAAVAAREVLERPSAELLERACAEFFARRFVAGTRFDPLHDAGTEQALHDRLPGWLAVLGRGEAGEATLEHGGRAYTVRVTTAELAAAIAQAAQPLIQKLRSLLTARGGTVLQVAGPLAELPGFAAALAALPGCTVVALEPGATARGALRLPPRPPGEDLQLVTSLPFDLPAAPEPAPGPAVVAEATPPTHLFFEGRAYRLGRSPLHIGAEVGDGEFGLRLDGRATGVSRRHCTLRVEDGRVLAYDQSRYGTLLNGHRIDGVAVLEAGDVLGIGQPPIELRLIAEVTGDA